MGHSISKSNKESSWSPYISELESSETLAELVFSLEKAHNNNVLHASRIFVTKGFKKHSKQVSKESKLEAEKFLLWLLRITAKLKKINQQQEAKVQTEKRRLQTELQTAHGKLEQQNETIQYQKELLKQKKQQLSDYRDQVDQQTGGQNRIGNGIGNQRESNKYVMGIQQQLVERDAEIGDLRQRNKSLLSEVSNLTQNNNYLLSEFQTVQNEKNVYVQKLQNESRLEQVDQTLRYLQSNLARAKSEVSEKENQLQRMESKLKDVQATNNGLRKEIHASCVERKELQTKLNQEEQNRCHLQRKLAQMETAYTEQQQFVTNNMAIAAHAMDETKCEKAIIKGNVITIKGKFEQQSRNIQEQQSPLHQNQWTESMEKKSADEIHALKAEIQQLYASNEHLKIQLRNTNTEINKLQSELGQKLLQVRELETEKDRISAEKQQLIHEHSRVKAKKDQLENEIRILQHKGQSQELQRFQEVEARLDAAEIELAKKKRELTKLKKDKKKIYGSNDRLHAEVNAEKTKNEELQKELYSLQQQLEEKQIMITEHERRQGTLGRLKSDLESRQMDHARQFDILQGELTKKNELVQSQGKQLSHLGKQVKIKESEIASAHAKVSEEKMRAERFQKDLAEMEQSVQQLEHQLGEKMKVIDEYERQQRKLGRLKSDLENKQMHHTKLAEKVALLQDELSQKRELIQRQKKQLSESGDQHKMKENEIASLHVKINEGEMREHDLQNELAKVRQSHQQLDSQLGEKRMVIAEHERKQKKFDQLQSDLENKETDHVKQLRNLHDQLNKKDELIQNQQRQLSQSRDQDKMKDSEIISLKANVNKYAAANQELKMQIDRNMTELRQLQKQLETVKQNVCELKGEIHKKEKVIGDQKHELQQMNLQLVSLQTATTHTQQDARHAELEISRLKQELDQKQKDIGDMRRDQVHRDHSINDLKHKLSQAHSEIKTLEANLAYMKQELTQRNSELAALERQKQQLQGLTDTEKTDHDNVVRQHKNKNHEMQREIKQLHHQIAERESLIQQLKDKSSRMESDGNKAKVQQLLNELQQQREQHIREIVSKDQKIGELSKKLAAEMSTKLAADESNVENVSIKNRPMNIAEEYQLLCSNQWLDAKSTLDDMEEDLSDIIKLHLLSEVLMVSERECRQKFDTIISHFELMLFNPIKCVFEDINTKLLPNKAKLPKSGNKLSKELNNMYGDMLRTAADSVDIGNLVKDILQSLNNSHKEFPIWSAAIQDQTVRLYVEDTARLCWKMVIQRPSMEFKPSTTWLGDKYLDLYWNSDSSPNAVVVQVYPMLYHGPSLMAKGKVLMKDPEKLQRDERRLIEKRS